MSTPRPGRSGVRVGMGFDVHAFSDDPTRALTLGGVVFEGAPPADEAALKAALLRAPRTFDTRCGSIWDEWRSQAIKCMKRPDPELAWHLARGVAHRLVRPAEYRAT